MKVIVCYYLWWQKVTFSKKNNGLCFWDFYCKKSFLQDKPSFFFSINALFPFQTAEKLDAWKWCKKKDRRVIDFLGLITSDAKMIFVWVVFQLNCSFSLVLFAIRSWVNFLPTPQNITIFATKKTRLEYVPVLSRGGGLKITIRCVPFKEMVNKYKFGTSNCKINKIT